MARRSRSNNRTRAMPVAIARPLRVRPRPVLPPYRPYDAFAGKLTVLEDRRQFHPMRAWRPAFSIPRAAARLVAKEPRNARRFGAQTRAVIAFANPRRVLVCLRRKARREVLLALGQGGGRKGRKPRRTEYSDVRC